MKDGHKELGQALSEGFRYNPANKPPLRPGLTVRLRRKNDDYLCRVVSEEDVEAIKNAKEPAGTEEV